MTSTYTKIVADSICNDIRLTTLECYYPLMIHSQLMTHRMFSRNAQSNRAMPVAKMLEQVRNNPAMPSHWGKNQAGMQACEQFGDEKILDFKEDWRQAAYSAARESEYFMKEGLHKQVANRLTMPFQYIKVIVTATEWDNFFKLRLHDADPTMMELASKMKEAMDDSFPRVTAYRDWHLPYTSNEEMSVYNNSQLRRISVARCARVSYNNHDNSSPDIQKDLALADRLLKDGHMSPFEHVCTPMKIAKSSLGDEFWSSEEGITHLDSEGDKWSGNFRGWIMYRNLV